MNFQTPSPTSNPTTLSPPSTSQIEQIFTTLIESLDTSPNPNSNPTPVLPQLINQPRIIINGQPFGTPIQFQSLWNSLPLSNHQITSCDIHYIPSGNGANAGDFVILSHLKVRFDESGKNKLGDSTIITNTSTSSRPLWSHWFGVSLTCIIDSNILNNINNQSISVWDYRFTENPSNSIFKIT